MADSPGLFTLNPRFSRTLTVDHLQVPSTQTDFPILVSFTDATFKTISNGGHVRNASGYDIGFYSNPNGSTKLKWEMEFYDAVNGIIVAWVKISSISSVSDTVFYMFYGDSSITTNQSDPINVWTNSFLGVYHLKDGTTLSVADSTGSHNGTNNAATATTGQIDGSGAFDSTLPSQIDIGSGMHPVALTYSAWINATTFPHAYSAVINRAASVPSTNSLLDVKSTGKLRCSLATSTGVTAYDGLGSHTLSAGTWYYIGFTYDSSSGLIGYVNAASDHTVAADGNADTLAASTLIGNFPVTFGREWNGKIDEVHISSVARSADWITCEYNNQKTSSTFVALGSEV